jgi:hypothetical protein
MRGRKQEAWYEVVLSDRTLGGPVEGVTTANVQSKLSAKIRELTIQHNFDEGAKITFRLAAAEVDEYANPER